MNKRIHIATITREQAFDRDKPRYNAHAVGHGVIPSKKAYTRKVKHKGKPQVEG